MFDDKRSKKVIMLSHCLLNQNAISDGTADYPSQFTEIVEFLMAQGIGMLQLPCPEFLCLGLARGDRHGATRRLLDENTRIRALMSENEHVQLLQQKAEEIVGQVREYRTYGLQVLGLIGVDRSPSCGIDTTSRQGAEVPGKGVFMEVLSETFTRHRIPLRMIGTKTSEPARSLERVREFLE